MSIRQPRSNIERFRSLATKLRRWQANVEGDYKDYFGDRATQVESWIESLENDWPFDETYVNEASSDLEKLCDDDIPF